MDRPGKLSEISQIERRQILHGITYMWRIEKKTAKLIETWNRKEFASSSQDGGLDRYASLPHTTKRRITTNLKTKDNRTARKSDCMEVQQPRSQRRNIHPDHSTMQRNGLPCHGKYLRLCPLQCNKCTKTKKYSPNERTGQNSRKITKWQGDSQPITCRVQNTGNQDAHRNDWVWLQNKGRNEGYTKLNKGKYMGNQ